MLRRRSGRRHPTAAYTLLELLTVTVVVAILLVMLFPIYTQIVRRMDRAKCMTNLKALHVATDLYLQDHHMWPQVATKGIEPKTVAANWISTLQPYSLTQINWVCPTRQKLLESPDLSDPENARLDYTPTPFDRNPMTPMRWSTQPWFAENGDVHGNGNLMIFPDGHIQELGDFLALLHKTPSK